MRGQLDVQWIHGSPGCSRREPPLQVHRYDPDTVIIRESKCADSGTSGQLGPSFEAPFMYLLCGESRALLLDTGTSDREEVVPIGPTVREILRERATERGEPPLPLVVCHTHSHEDHVAGDAQFPDETVVGYSPAEVRAFFGVPGGVNQTGSFELGNRTVDVIPTPGHEPAHIAVYDRKTGLLFTGDLLYPGLLTVNDWRAYRRSVLHLAEFASTREVTHILGAHIEMKKAPGKFYGYPHPFHQPEEHTLPLEARHLEELRDAVQAIGPTLTADDRHADFILHPGHLPPPPEDP
jgi:hydroxyacylglutathione hydrolase